MRGINGATMASKGTRTPGFDLGLSRRFMMLYFSMKSNHAGFCRRNSWLNAQVLIFGSNVGYISSII